MYVIKEQEPHEGTLQVFNTAWPLAVLTSAGHPEDT